MSGNHDFSSGALDYVLSTLEARKLQTDAVVVKHVVDKYGGSSDVYRGTLTKNGTAVNGLLHISPT